MKILYFIVVKFSTYNKKTGYREWYELQPQYDNKNIYISMENINESTR